MKIFKIKKVILAVGTAFVLLSSLPFIQSCSSSDETLQIQSSKNTSLEYLDVDVSNLQKATDEQKQIIKKAIDRVNPYVLYKNKTYSLTITKGSEIQISERVFNFIKATILNTNTVIKDLNVVSDAKNNKILHITSSSNLQKNVRFKAPGETPPAGQCGVDYSWYGCDVYLTAKACNSISNACYAGGTVLGTASLICGGTVVGAPAALPLGVAAGCVGLGGPVFAELANQYPDGCVIHMVYSPIPGAPLVPYGVNGR